MKKVLIATGVAVLAVAMIASAQGYAFNTNLTVGSTGSDVVALQTLLMASGYDIPAIASGAAAKGYFGSQTKAAVVKYQAANGIPNTGFVGPLTRASLNGSTVATNCPAGMTCTPNTAPVVNCPVGFTCTPIGSPVINNTNGTDGSISVSDSSFVSSGQNIKKGESKNVVAVKLQATAGPVTVTRLDVHFSVRPWLFFSQATLTDSSGKVLATKALNSASDVTEITVGSDYLVRFDGLNYLVTPGTNPDLAVGVSVLAATDKITNGMTVYAGIPTSAIRTVNGLGITDSLGGIAFSTNASGVGARSFTLSSTGSVADISTKISSVAPATQATVPVSATVPTNNVTLGIFSLKSANNTSTLNALNFQVQTYPAFTQTGLFSNLRIMVGSSYYGALSFSAAGLATFTNLTINLPQDQWVDIKLIADVAATGTDVLASSTIVANTINAIDNTYTAATVGGAAMADATNNQTSVNTLLTVNSVSITPVACSTSNNWCITQEIKGLANSNITTAAAVAFTFTLTNNSSNNLYVSSDVSEFISATTTTPASNASSTISTIEPMAAVPGDDTTTGYYILPQGQGRTFTVSGIIQKSSGTVKSERLSITGIEYSTTGARAAAGTGDGTITSGIETLTTAIVI